MTRRCHDGIVVASWNRIENKLARGVGHRCLHRHAARLHGDACGRQRDRRIEITDDPQARVRQNRKRDDHRFQTVLAGVPTSNHRLAGVEIKHDVSDLVSLHIDVDIQFETRLLGAGRCQRGLCTTCGRDGISQRVRAVVLSQYQAQLRVFAGRQRGLPQFLQNTIRQSQQIDPSRRAQDDLGPASIGICRARALVHTDLLNGHVDSVIPARRGIRQ